MENKNAIGSTEMIVVEPVTIEIASNGNKSFAPLVSAVLYDDQTLLVRIIFFIDSLYDGNFFVEQSEIDDKLIISYSFAYEFPTGLPASYKLYYKEHVVENATNIKTVITSLSNNIVNPTTVRGTETTVDRGSDQSS